MLLNFQDQRKPIVMLQSLLHAREWVTLPASLYAIEKLVIDITDRDLVDNIDWIIVPIVNPDGYEWSHINVRTLHIILMNKNVIMKPKQTFIMEQTNKRIILHRPASGEKIVVLA